MGRSNSSSRWLKEHFDDPFVAKAKKEGLRSRAAYKLIELQEKDRIFKHGDRVVDLGAAPGGWTQVVNKFIGKKGQVIASDILEMEPLPDVRFIQGDFTEQKVFDQILDALENQQADVVISDMAPNMSGNSSIDQPSSMYLIELAVDLLEHVLVKGGSFVTKMFQGEGSDAFLSGLRARFTKVLIRKPEASRGRSREVYVVAKGFKA